MTKDNKMTMDNEDFDKEAIRNNLVFDEEKLLKECAYILHEDNYEAIFNFIPVLDNDSWHWYGEKNIVRARNIEPLHEELHQIVTLSINKRSPKEEDWTKILQDIKILWPNSNSFTNYSAKTFLEESFIDPLGMTVERSIDQFFPPLKIKQKYWFVRSSQTKWVLDSDNILKQENDYREAMLGGTRAISPLKKPKLQSKGLLKKFTYKLRLPKWYPIEPTVLSSGFYATALYHRQIENYRYEIHLEETERIQSGFYMYDTLDETVLVMNVYNPIPGLRYRLNVRLQPKQVIDSVYPGKLP